MNKIIIKGITSPGTSIVMLHDEVIYESNTSSLEVSDGYHTMTELYQHRYALFCALCKVYDGYITPLGSRVSCWKSKLHYDGTMFEGCFIVQMVINLNGKFEQLSYHLPLSWWDKFKLMEMPKAMKWDGHTSQDVIERLLKL